MDKLKVIAQLKEKYPGKKIISLPAINPTEIICEIDPSSAHPDYSVAISVIDKTDLHYHEFSTETYKILHGELDMYIDEVAHHMKQGDVLVVKPHNRHYAIGKETWIECRTEPGWVENDHIVSNN